MLRVNVEPQKAQKPSEQPRGKLLLTPMGGNGFWAHPGAGDPPFIIRMCDTYVRTYARRSIFGEPLRTYVLIFQEPLLTRTAVLRGCSPLPPGLGLSSGFGYETLR